MSVLLLDNFDSFTYNLKDYIASLGYHVIVMRNDSIDLESLERYSHIVLSPGPGLPSQSGFLMDLIARQIGIRPILGICLGMQALAEHLGDTLYNLKLVRHGVEQHCCRVGESVILRNIEREFIVGLYHSWAITGNSDRFNISSKSTEGVIMSIENPDLRCYGVQFHPESIMTVVGKQILQNFFQLA